MTLTIELVNPQRTILAEISNKLFTRDSVATTYAFCLHQRDQCDFGVINRAILDRWSMNALEYIKKKAWQRFESLPPYPGADQ